MDWGRKPQRRCCVEVPGCRAPGWESPPGGGTLYQKSAAPHSRGGALVRGGPCLRGGCPSGLKRAQTGDRLGSGPVMMEAPEGRSHSSLLGRSTHFDNLQIQERNM